MKVIKILSVVLLATTLIMSCSSDDDNSLYTSPQAMESFAKKHFPNNKVIEIKEVIFGKKKTFEVKLEGNIELTFNSDGDLIKVESKTKIPDSLIPSKIRDFISTYYPDNFIIEWELEDEHQTVELNDDIELKFEMNGDYINAGQGSWAGNEEYSYITRDEATNTVYARTVAGYFITSEKIMSFPLGTVAFISYQINLDDVAERTMIGESQNIIVYHAVLAGEPEIVEQTPVKFMEVPETPIFHFENLMNPTFASNNFFGDRWLFPFQVKLKKGETVKANFYKAADEIGMSNDEVIIDIRLTKNGEAEDGASDKMVIEYVVADFSYLRMMYEGSNKEVLNIKFRFYRSANKDELYTTTERYPLQLK